MSSKIDIENIHCLQNLWNFVSSCQEASYMNRILAVFPFEKLQNINNKENMEYILKLLTKLLDVDDFMNKEDDINHCVEFVLKNFKCLSADDSILENFFNYFSAVLTRFGHIQTGSNVNIDPERICLLIYDLFKNITWRKKCMQVLIKLFNCATLNFGESDIYDTCINEFYKQFYNFEFLELCKLGSVIISISTRFCNFITKANLFYHWIEITSPNVLSTLSDELIREFLKCLSRVYSTKKDNYFDLTKTYVSKIKIFERYLTNRELQEDVVVILRCMLYDLSSQGILPIVDDFCDNIFEPRNQILSNKDFIIVTTYLNVIYTRAAVDENEIYKQMTRICLFSDSFYPVTLKAMCYLYPKYIKDREKINATSNMILYALANSAHFEKVLSYDTDQLKWILNSEKDALKHITLCSWLRNFKNDGELLAIIEKTKNLKILIQILLTDTHMYDISKRAANLLKLANNPVISRRLIRNIPTAIRNPVSLAHVLHANPAIPENVAEATFFCKVMATIIPEMVNTEAFVGVCSYSFQLAFHMRNCSEAIRHFNDNNRTINTLRKASLNKNEEVSLAGLELLGVLVKLERRHHIIAKAPLELDFKELLTGSSKRILKSLRLLQDTIKENSEPGLIELSEDVLGQYLFLQTIQNEELMEKSMTAMILFLKKYSYLAYSTITPIFVRMQCLSINENQSAEVFMNFLELVLKIVNKRFARLHYWHKCIRKVILNKRAHLMSVF